MTRLLLITDAWTPQTNGVVTTWKTVIEHLRQLDVAVEVVHAGLFHTWPLPTYPEIRIARDPWFMKMLLGENRPDHVHIATEGPLGIYGRRLCRRVRLPFTTSLHTKFPEYAYERVRLSLASGYRFMRWFHRAAVRTLCTTESHRRELTSWGFENLVVWGRGVDIEHFQVQVLRPRARPVALYVGRIAVEKNVAAFLDLPGDLDKVVVGDGPLRAGLEKSYPQVRWLGYRHGQDLVDAYAQADVLVFPSKTDTFGLVMLEANACGTPVAAYPVTGPVDVVQPGVNGVLDLDLAVAVRGALEIPRASCRAYAQTHTWTNVAQRLKDNLEPIDWSRVRVDKLR